MGDTTIEWTDKTHNEWIGCQKVTEEECGDCYALRYAIRHGMQVWGSLCNSDKHLTKTHDNPRLLSMNTLPCLPFSMLLILKNFPKFGKC